MIASFVSAFTAAWNIKEKLKYVLYLLFPSLTSSVFVPELDIMNVNVTSQTIITSQSTSQYSLLLTT